MTVKYTGDVLTYKADKAYTAGDIITVGSLTGIAGGDAKKDELVSVLLKGVFELEKDNAAIDLGAKVYAVNGKVSATKGSTGVDLGYCFAAADASATTVDVKIG
jgi:predicted RecA/RadA family phage recombinase